MAGPRLAVPPISALPPSVSLLVTARKLGLIEEPPADNHWMLGFVRELEGCGITETYDPCSDELDFTPPTAEGNRDYVPFGIRAGDSCSAFDYKNRNYAARALQALSRCESFQIANEFWTGTRATASGWADNEFLASPTSDNITEGGSLDPVPALACMEKALGVANCGSLSMIHADPSVVTHWASDGLVTNVDNVLRTQLGTIVVSDAGYPGTSPDGDDPTDGNVWIYGTGLFHVRLSPVQSIPDPTDFAAATSRPDNQITFWAQRIAAITWEQCAHIAAAVDIPACDVGGS